jgi:hypothetical protein
MELNEIKKDLYKSKAIAKLTHYVSGNLYYTVELVDGVYQFPISTVEAGVKYTVAISDDGISNIDDVETIQLSSDLGTTTFDVEMKGSDLNRWIAKAVEKGEFIKIS